MTEPARPPSRYNGGFLSGPEERALAWLTPRTPAWWTPDRLTALGLAGAVLALAGYLMSARHPAALWLVNLGLVVNWLGDSLDGHVARARRIERPVYGFFLDQSVDVIAQLLFSIGLAASGYVRPEIVMLGFATYLMMTVQSLLRMKVSGTFQLATAGMGLTEVRCFFLVANAAFFLVPPWPVEVAGTTFRYPDFFGLVWIVTNVVLYVVTLVAESRRLSRQDRPDGPSNPTERE